MPLVRQLDPDRVRTRRWKATGTDLPTVIDQLRRLDRELRQYDVPGQEHPHPRNSVLNLVIATRERQRAETCDRLLGRLSTTHPMRAILLHLGSDEAAGTLDASIVAEAHRLNSGFPVQRQQVLLEVRGAAVGHLASFVEPLLIPDIPTFLWWSGREELDHEALGEVIDFSDMVVVDSSYLESPVDGLLNLTALTGGRLGVADLRWGRMRPWRDAIGQFFAPSDRLPLLAGLDEITCEAAGVEPSSRVAAALLAGWAAAALGWRFTGTSSAGESATQALAETDGGRQTRVTLRSVPSEHVEAGELMAVGLNGQAEDGPFEMSMERDRGGGEHARLSFTLGAETVHQRLALPAAKESDLLLHVLWASRRDPVFESALAGASILLESLR